MNTTTHVELEARFAAIPEALLYDQSVAADAVRVYGVLIRHGSDPANCYPGYARIASFLGKSARSVPAWIKALEDAGWIERVPRWRRGDEVTTVDPQGEKGWEPTSNAYRVFSQKRATERGVPAGERVPPRAGERGESALGSAPKESKGNDSKGEQPLFGEGGSTDATFDAFWTAYPRKIAKGDARKAWDAAVKRSPSAAAIVAGATRYARERKGADPKFTAHPATWLRGDRWGDEPSAAQTEPESTIDDWSNFQNREARR